MALWNEYMNNFGLGFTLVANSHCVVQYFVYGLGKKHCTGSTVIGTSLPAVVGSESKRSSTATVSDISRGVLLPSVNRLSRAVAQLRKCDIM